MSGTCELIVDKVFGYATSETLRKAKHTNVGLRDQRTAFECKFKTNYEETDIITKEFRGTRQHRGLWR